MICLTLSVMGGLAIAAIVVALTSSGPQVRAQPAFDGGRERALAAYAGVPLTFVENRGQADERVRFHA
jgi:hypothetical protein